MLITKGSLLQIKSSRKGSYKATAEKDFHTDREEWYPVMAAEFIKGISTDWEIGEPVPCRAELCVVVVIRQGPAE